MHMRKHFHPYKALAAFLCFLLLNNSAAAQWVRRADALQTRSEATSVIYKGKYYVFLGFGNSDLVPAANSEVYDPATGLWQLLAPIPAGKAMTHQGIAQLGDQVWHIGGRVGKHPGVLTSEIWIYHIGSDTWSQGPSLLNPATGSKLLWGGGGAAYIDRTLHVWGGFVGTACNGDQSTFHLTLDVDAWQLQPSLAAPWKNVKAPMPLKRNHFGTVLLNGKIYAIGGQTGHDCGGGLDQRWAHAYDPANNSWQRLPDMPEPRSHIEGSIFALDGKIYVLGGQVANNANTRKVTVFDPVANNGQGQWTNVDILLLPSAYEGPASKVIGSTLLFSHGGEGSSRNVRRTLFTRTIGRNPDNRFLFPSGCNNISLLAGTSAQGQVLMFTTDSSAAYTVSSNAPWLMPTVNASGTAAPNGITVGYTVDASTLLPGTYSASLVVAGEGFAAASYCVNLRVGSRLLEAENAVRVGGVFANYNPGYTGTGYVDYKNATGDYIEWTVEMPSVRSMELQIRYANGGTSNRPMRLSVNGTVVTQSLAFPVTGSFRNWAYAKLLVNLAAGVNTIRLTANGASGPNTDHLVVAPPPAPTLATTQSQQGPADTRSFSVAPNPVSGTTLLTLDWVPNQPVMIQVVDAGGNVRRQVRHYKAGSNKIPLSLSGLPPDTYLLLLRSGNWMAGKQVLVTP